MKVVDQHFKAAIAGARANITVNGYIITSQPSDEYGNLVFSSEYLPKQDNFNASFFINDVRFYQKEFMFTVYYNTTRVVELAAYMAIRLNATTNSSSITGYNFSLYYLNSTMVGSRQTDMYGSAVMFVERVYVFNGMANNYQVRGQYDYSNMYKNITTMITIPTNQYTYEQNFSVEQGQSNETVYQVMMYDNNLMPASGVYVHIYTNRSTNYAYSDY